MTRLAEAAEALHPRLLALFQDLHAHPEIGFEEHRTTSAVAEELDRIGFAVRTSDAVTGVVGVLENGPGPVVALRADLDALAIVERTGLPYSSEHGAVGAMHACGHDIHTVGLLGTAQLLADARADWSGTVVAIAQPAEETGEGARRFIASGILDDVPRPDVVVGQHVGGREGEQPFGARPGITHAGQRNWRVTVRTTGGHAAGPHRAANPATYLAQLVLRLQAALPTAVAASEEVVLVPTTVHAGSGSNIIAASGSATFCARAFSDEVLDALDAEVERVARGLAQAEGIEELEIERFNRFPLNVNDPDALVRVRELLADEFAAEFADAGGFWREPDRLLGSEDFGELPVHWQAPGVFWFFDGGTAPSAPDREAARRGHSPTFAPNPELALRRGVRGLTAVTLGLLTSRPSSHEQVAGRTAR